MTGLVIDIVGLLSYEEWKTDDGIKLSHHDVAIWGDQGRPYVILDIEGTEYNVDVSEKIPQCT